MPVAPGTPPAPGRRPPPRPPPTGAPIKPGCPKASCRKPSHAPAVGLHIQPTRAHVHAPAQHAQQPGACAHPTAARRFRQPPGSLACGGRLASASRVDRNPWLQAPLVCAQRGGAARRRRRVRGRLQLHHAHLRAAALPALADGARAARGRHAVAPHRNRPAGARAPAGGPAALPAAQDIAAAFVPS